MRSVSKQCFKEWGCWMNDELPLVCICVPTYNAASTVRETLESILAQTYSNLVVHVSDNASTDDTLKVIESIADSRVTIHRHVENIGGEGNFNRCIQLAEGKYTAIFHADDIYEPEMVARQVAFLEAHPEAGAVFTEASLIDEGGNRIGEIRLPKGIERKNELYDFETMFKAVLRHSNFFICPSVMVRTQVYQQEIKCWRGDLFKSSSDLDVWFRVLQYHAIGIIPECLMRYRISNGQYSANLRSRTIRADFFRVTDYYLAQVDVQILLSLDDWKNYRRLERTDRVIRAVNLYLLDQKQEALVLCLDVLSADALRGAVHDRRGFITLAAGIALRLFIFLRVSAIGKPFLLRLKRFTRR